MISNSKWYLLTMGIILIISLLLYNSMRVLFEYRPNYGYLSILILTIGSLVSHFIVQYISSIKGKPFVQVVMMTFVFRLILYSLLAFIIILLVDNAFSDLVIFGSFYLILVLHELIFIVLNPIPNTVE